MEEEISLDLVLEEIRNGDYDWALTHAEILYEARAIDARTLRQLESLIESLD